MLRTIILAALLALSGCATCERHPIVCTVAAGVVIGSIAASEWHSGGCVGCTAPAPQVRVK